MKKVIYENACNSHLHIIDPAFPNDGKATSQTGTVGEYRALADKMGIARAVFVQAKPFGVDNSCLLDAIRRFGYDKSRGIAVVSDRVSDAEILRLHEAGVRGLRFSLWNPKNAVVSFDMCFSLSERTRELGWNTQFHMSAAQLKEYAPGIERIAGNVVIDHMGRLDPALGTKDPVFSLICRWIDRGRTWMKLSGPYLNTLQGYPWEDADCVARAFASYAPERVVWGNDFPHVTEAVKPDEDALAETIDRWFPNERGKYLALVENPAQLYGFGE